MLIQKGLKVKVIESTDLDDFETKVNKFLDSLYSEEKNEIEFQYQMCSRKHSVMITYQKYEEMK